jgi:hypothetical protein
MRIEPVDQDALAALLGDEQARARLLNILQWARVQALVEVMRRRERRAVNSLGTILENDHARVDRLEFEDRAAALGVLLETLGGRP